MADYAALQEQNKLAALRAMAEGNPDPFAGSSGVISGAQDEALQRYAGEAAGRGAPAGSVSQGEAMIRGPGDAALGGIGKSSDAYSAELTALHNEAANPAIPPQSFGSGSSGSGGSKQKGPGYNQYGGYETAAEYENAVLGRAVQAEQERKTQVEGENVAAQAPVIAQGSQGLAQALAAQQAGNEAVVGGPGAIIHGAGWAANPTPWTPATPAPAPPVVAHADPTGQRGNIPVATRLAARTSAAPPAPEYVGRPGFGYYAPAGTAGTPSATERSNYSPEQVAMLRAAADQSRERFQGNQQWLGGMEAAGAEKVAAIEDPRNLYGFAQRAAINEFGGDPYEAIGRFSPEWGMKTYAIPQATGPLDYQAAQNETFERNANQAAGLGAYTDSEIRGREADIARQSADYETGKAVAEAQLNSLAGGPKSNEPVTIDGLRTALAQAGVDPTAALQVIKDYGRLYPGVSFFNQPEEQAQAAAQAGNRNG